MKNVFLSEYGNGQPNRSDSDYPANGGERRCAISTIISCIGRCTISSSATGRDGDSMIVFASPSDMVTAGQRITEQRLIALMRSGLIRTWRATV
jgi:hypothetical protein